MELNIEDGVKSMIPPLTLQPLVENAVRHGIAVKDQLRIIVHARRREDGFVVITVEDNGPGMSDEKQQQLLGGSSKRLGFSNVMKKINAQRRASITLESWQDEGTKISIVVPEAKEYESNNN